MSENLVRVNIRVSPEVHQHYLEKSKRTGVSMSALCFLALEKQMNEEKFMGNGLPELLKLARQMGIEMNPVEKALSEAVLDGEKGA